MATGRHAARVGKRHIGEATSTPATSTPATSTPATSTAGFGRMLARGAMFSSLSTALLRLGQFVVSVVIARLISPHDFGVFVVASTVYLIVISVSEIGVSAALVREVDNADRIAPTIATIATANSTLLATVLLVAAPWISSAFGAPAAAPAVRVLAIPLLLAGPTAVPSALLTRDFKQGRRMVTDLVNFGVGNGVLLVLAMHGSGVMALAWSRVAGQAVSAVLLCVLAPKWYWPGFDRREAARLLRFGSPLAGASLAAFTLNNVDFMVTGRLAGPLQLGYYNLAFTVSAWPSSIFTTILTSVTLPALTRVKGGMAELSRHVAAALAALCAASFPIAVACLVLARPLVAVVYGERWAPAAPVLAILAVFGGVRVIIPLFYDVLVALDHTMWLFRLQLIWLGALTPAMFLGVHAAGGRGAALAHVAVLLAVVIPVYLMVLGRAVRFPLRVLRTPTVYPLLAAVLAGAVCALAAAQVGPAWAKLLVGSAVFAAAYLLVLGRWLVGLGRELAALYGRRRAPAPAPAEEMAVPVSAV